MNIREQSSKFTIFVFAGDVNMGASAKVALSSAGYDTYYFQDLNDLMNRVLHLTPHIVVYTTASLPGSLSNFVRNVLTLNDEIKFLAVASVAQFSILAQYNDLGLVDVISDEDAALDNRIVWAVDRACERLYLSYQNEQLFEKNLELQSKQNQPAAANIGTKLASEKSNMVVSIRVTEYLASSSKEDILQCFMKSLGHFKCVYFKFLPTVNSFVATHSNGFGAQDIQGVGAQLSDLEVKNLASQISVGLLPPSLNSMLVEAFRFNPPRGWPLFVQNQLEGLVVYSGDISPENVEKPSEEFSLFRLMYSHFCLEKKVENLEVLDPITEVLNRTAYLKILKEEIDRARRLHHPLSIVKIAMDDYYEIEQSQGESTRDQLLRSLALLINKTSRANDKTARTGLNEFAMVLPHCTKKGAALRAERIRRIVEGSPLLENGVKVSISLGVSEFPSLCTSSESLDDSSTKALLHIVDKGGNKICLFKAPDDHKPEFEVTIE